MKIKSFRGLIADGAQDILSLHTNTGSTGYRIIKFQVLSNDLNINLESTVKIYSIPQDVSTIDEIVDFSDNTLLGVATFNQGGQNYYNPGTVVIFDNMKFNQDIYITHKCHDNSGPINYYIELEQVKLDLNENTVATLKDIRNIESNTYV